jgi:lysophospholipase L1-like esterase
MMTISGPCRRPLVVAVALLLSGVAVRSGWAEDAARFGRWEKDIQEFEKQDREKPAPEQAILFAGSSSIRLWDLHQSFPGLETINRGFGGSEIRDSVHFAPRIILKYKPRLIVFYAGDNDIAAGRSPEQVLADFKALVQEVHAALPRTKILFLSIKPSIQRWKLVDKIRQANALIEAFCKQDDRLTYVDVGTALLGKDGKPRPELFRPDGLHLNTEGYKVWASLLEPYLK